MVVFGAGASYDSVPNRYLPIKYQDPNGAGGRPPLAKHLVQSRRQFLEVLKRYHDAHHVVGLLRAIEQTGQEFQIERELQRIQEHASRDPRIVRQLAAFRFYLRDILYGCSVEWDEVAGGPTNYGPLLEQIEAWRIDQDEPVLLITFNYDVLLEKALTKSFQRSFQDVEDYIKTEYPLIKLHGSVTWGHPVKGGDVLSPSSLILRADELEILPEVQVVSTDQTGFFPALAIPVESKADFECPLEHQEVLEQLLPHVSRILIVGWRAQEKTFLGLCRRGLRHVARVKTVNGRQKEGEAVLKAISDAGLAFDALPPEDGGFSDFVGRGSLRDLL